MIKYLHRKQIDSKRWDEVIANSPAETIYAYTWYLDAAAGQWSALIADDYQYVMPIIWRKRYGIRYAYHPGFVQQLGVFGKELADPLIIRMFLEKLPSRLKYGNLRFNTSNLVGEEDRFEVNDRVNYELKLDRDYSSLLGSYTTNTVRNLKKAMDLHHEISEDISIDELLGLKVDTNISDSSREYLTWMKKLFNTILDHDAGRIIGIRKKGILQAAACFVFSRSRAIYLLSASSEDGKESRAMFSIVDYFIKKYAGSGLILDFEGSNIPSIARFFGGFGAAPKIYQAVDFARFPLTLIKNLMDGGND